MKKILTAIFAVMTIIVLALTGCNAAQTTTPHTTPPSVTAPITPTPSPTTQPALDAVDNLVIDFIKNTATFKV